jgi:hypothetical protein
MSSEIKREDIVSDAAIENVSKMVSMLEMLDCMMEDISKKYNIPYSDMWYIVHPE